MQKGISGDLYFSEIYQFKMTDLNTTKLEIIECEGERSEQKEERERGEEVVSKTVDDTKKKVEDFPCGLCENKSRTKSAKELHMKRKHNDKSIQYTPSPSNRKIGYTCFFVAKVAK